MTRGVIDKAYLDDQLVNDTVCTVTCLLNDPLRLDPRKTSFIQEVLPKYLGEIDSDVYEIEVEVPYPVTAELAADIDDTVLTFEVTAATAQVISKDGYLNIGGELMIVESVVGTTVTVLERGYSSIAAAHVAGDEINTLANVKASCELLGDCRRPTFTSEIKNASQLIDDCVEYCKKDLCKGLKSTCDIAGRDKVINDVVEKQRNIARKNYLEQLDNLFINGGYGMITKNGKKAYTTRGLRQWILGTVDGENVTHGGFVYDILAEDTCVGTAGDGTGRLTHEALQAFYIAAGEKAAPLWNRVILNWESYLALDAVADKSEKCCTAGGQDKNLKNTLLGNTISTPYGDVEIIINNNVRAGEMYFYNTANIGWYSDCEINGQALRQATYDLDFEDKNKKFALESHLAFDAAQNMCTELAMLHGFVKDTLPCA